MFLKLKPTLFQEYMVQISHLGVNRKLSTCKGEKQLKITDSVPCIKFLIDWKSEKLPLGLINLNFQAFYLSITTGLISSKKFPIDSFKHVNVSAHKHHRLFA